MKNYLAFGCGVNSVALYLLLRHLGRNFEAVFVDHGTDWPETYTYFKKFSAKFPVTRIRPHVSVARTGKTYNNLYDYCWDKHVVPYAARRWCTKKFKADPLQEYMLKDDEPCREYIGLDASEERRKADPIDPRIHHAYPLIAHRIDRERCRQMILKAGLPVPPNSKCFICPFQTLAEWKQMYVRYPVLFARARMLEQRNRDYARRQGKKAWAMRMDGNTLWDLEKRFRKELREM